MANLDFPSNPTVGQVHSIGDKSWRWTGVAWAVQRVTQPGKSAYELAIQNGFVGTEAAWIASLKGAKGDTGLQGTQGLQGTRGDKGDPGDRGIDGVNGTNGSNGVGVPLGGSPGQVLSKVSTNPYDTQWITPDYLSDYTVPLGGNQGQFLGKNSATDGDFSWKNLPAGDAGTPELPLGGNEGQVLTKNSTASGDVRWSDPVAGSGVPNGGTTGQVLVKNSEFNGDATWHDPVGGIEEAPKDTKSYVRNNGTWVLESTGSGSANYPDFTNNAGKFLKVNSTANGVEWATVQASGGTGSAAWAPVIATGTGASQTITLPASVASKYEIDVYVNGIHYGLSDYSVSDTTVTLTTNAAGDSIEIRSLGTGSGSGGGGTDLPSKTGNANKILAVTADETAVTWIDPPAGTGGGSGEPYYRMAGFFTKSPAVNEILAIYVLDVPITIPANFTDSQAKLIGAQPGATFVLSIRKNSTTEIGTLTVNTSGTITFATTNGTSKVLAVGDVISVHAPGLSDSITNLTWLLRGNK